MIFRTEGKEYQQETAVGIVLAMERDALAYPHQGGTLRQFLRWKLAQLDDRIPQRELDVSDIPDDEMLALSYLYLCDEYGVGELLKEPGGSSQ